MLRTPHGVAPVLALLLACRGAYGLGLREASAAGDGPPATGGTCNRGSSRPKLYTELGRPQFHFTPAKNWMNDPNGLVYYKGEYHLFFQHNPHGMTWGNMTWGHAVSEDLIHWEQLDHALRPDKMGDIFSGSALVDWHDASGLQSGQDPPIIAFYTNAPRDGTPSSQRLAYSQDKGRSWSRLPGAVIGSIKGATSARDPKVTWDKKSKQWVMSLWLFPRQPTKWKRTGVFSIMLSKDLKAWKQVQELELDMPGGECPDFFELKIKGDAEVRGTSYAFLNAEGYYSLGKFDGKSFTPSGTSGALEFGEAYASQTYNDVPGSRRIQISWLGKGKDGSCAVFGEEPFRGQMTLPVELELFTERGQMRLRRSPVKELLTLRRQPSILSVGGSRVTPEAPLTAVIPDNGLGLEVLLRVRQPKRGDRLKLRISTPGMPLQLEVAAARTSFNVTTSAGTTRIKEVVPASGWAKAGKRTLPLLADAHDCVELRAFVDRHSLEVFDSWGGSSMAICTKLPCVAGSWQHEAKLGFDGPGQVEAYVEKFEVFQLDSAVPIPAMEKDF